MIIESSESFKEFEGYSPDVIAGVEVNTFARAVGLKDARPDANDVKTWEYVDQIACLEHEVHGDGFGFETEHVLKDTGGEI